MHGNVFLSLGFHWNFDYIVYGAREKIFVLYCTVLSTFVIQALFFDGDVRGSNEDTSIGSSLRTFFRLFWLQLESAKPLFFVRLGVRLRKKE